MRKKRLNSMIPIFAIALFEADKPEKWDSLSDREKVEWFTSNMESTCGLCHHCSGNIETDFEVNDNALDQLEDDEYLEMMWETES